MAAVIRKIDIDVMPYRDDEFQGPDISVSVEVNNEDLQILLNRQKLIVQVFRQLILAPSFNEILKSLNVYQLKLSTMCRYSGDWFIRGNVEMMCDEEIESARYIVSYPEDATPLSLEHSEPIDRLFDEVDSLITALELKTIKKIKLDVFKTHQKALDELSAKIDKLEIDNIHDQDSAEDFKRSSIDSNERSNLLTGINSSILYHFPDYFNGIKAAALTLSDYLNPYKNQCQVKYNAKVQTLINEELKIVIRPEFPDVLYPLIINYISLKDLEGYENQIEIDIT